MLVTDSHPKAQASLRTPKPAARRFHAAALLIFASGVAFAGGLTAEQKRGKHIYLYGANLKGQEITAFQGNPETDVPGPILACVNCHGYDGRGKPEGGVIPSDVTWETLTKPYGVTHEGGRKHPPYDEESMARAITMLVDPAGNRLHLAMPRYEMSGDDLSDLVAYMKLLGSERDPGLADDAITLGTVVPDAGQAGEVGNATVAVLDAFFKDLNEAGGLYNRKIQLRVARLNPADRDGRAKLERFVEEQQVFALVAPFIAGADKEFVALMEEKEVPSIGPSTLYPAIGYPLNRRTFYLFSGQIEQSRALLTFAAEKLQIREAKVAVVYPEGPFAAETAAAMEEACLEIGCRAVAKERYVRGALNAPQLAKQLSGRGVDLVLFLGPGAEAVALAQAGDEQGWDAKLLCPGSLAGEEVLDIPRSLKERLYLSFPLLPSDQSPEAVGSYRAFAAKHKLRADHLALQFSAYCAAKILAAGLRLAGRDVSREKLINALEGLYKFETGLMQPVSYGPNRRIGAQGAHIVTVDPDKKSLVPAGGWIELP
jgi:ABC-type branched-subunit amino acid transport system substrate-binding protein